MKSLLRILSITNLVATYAEEATMKRFDFEDIAAIVLMIGMGAILVRGWF